jgi:hypothetical protein
MPDTISDKPGSPATPAEVQPAAPRADIQVKIAPPAKSDNQTILALVLLVAGLAIIIGTGAYWMYFHQSPGYTGGGAAAASGVLLLLALLVDRPALIMDDAPDAGGEPSTMRILTLIIVLTFAVLMVRTGWNTGTLPSLENQGNWIWLVTAAIGGKALQKFAEVQDKNK